MDEIDLGIHKKAIVDRLWDAFEIPHSETTAALDKFGGVPDTRFIKYMGIEYGVSIPERVEHLPMSVEDIPLYKVDERGRRQPYTTRLKLSLEPGIESRKMNLYGWVFKIFPADKVNLDFDYVYYSSQGTATPIAVVEYRSGKYFQSNPGPRKEILVTDMPANALLAIKLPPSVTVPKTYIVERVRINPQ
jgi:hypothetical protein